MLAILYMSGTTRDVDSEDPIGLAARRDWSTIYQRAGENVLHIVAPGESHSAAWAAVTRRDA